MDLVMQPSFDTCGQACVAMITGKTVGEVVRDMRTGGPASIGQLIDILNHYGVKHAERNNEVHYDRSKPCEQGICIR